MLDNWTVAWSALAQLVFLALEAAGAGMEEITGPIFYVCVGLVCFGLYTLTVGWIITKGLNDTFI